MGLLLTAGAGCSHPLTSPEISEWQWGPVLPQKKSVFGTAAASDRIVAVGGTCWRQEDGFSFTKVYHADVHQLLAGEPSWSRLPDYPHPIGYPLVIVNQRRVYVIGGHDGVTPRGEVRWLDLDAGAPSWNSGPSLPFPAGRVRGGVIDDEIYAVIQREGLADADRERDPATDACILAWDTRDPTSGWKQIGMLSEPHLQYRSVAVCGRELLFFGGGIVQEEGSMELQSRAAAFNVKTKTWRDIRPLPFAMRDASAVGLDDRFVLIAGGVEEAATAEATSDGAARIILVNQCLVYDGIMDAYTRLQPLRMAVADHGLAFLNGRIYAVAGEDSVYRTRTDLVQVGTLK